MKASIDQPTIFLALCLLFGWVWSHMLDAHVSPVRALWETSGRFRLQPECSVFKVFARGGNWGNATLNGSLLSQTLGNHSLPPHGPDGSADCIQFDMWAWCLFAESKIDPCSLLGAPEGDRQLLGVLRQKASAASFKESCATEGWWGLVFRRRTFKWINTRAPRRWYEDAVSQRFNGGGD